MNSERRQFQTPLLCCALVLLCSCIFCWESFGRPVRAQLYDSLDIVPFLTSCGFLGGCLLSMLLRRTSLCLRLLIACVLFGLGLSLASFTQDSSVYFCVTFCLIGGAGAGMTFCLCLLTVFSWIPTRRGPWFGLLCGSAFLSIALVDATVPHLFQDPSFGWHGAYLFLGLITATALFIAAFTLRLPEEAPQVQSGDTITIRERVCFLLLVSTFAVMWHTGTDYAIINSHHAGAAAALGAIASGFIVQQQKKRRLLSPCAWLMTIAAFAFSAAIYASRRDLAASLLMLCCVSGGMLCTLCLYLLGTSAARCHTAACNAALLLVVLCAYTSVPRVWAVSSSSFMLPAACLISICATLLLMMRSGSKKRSV